MTQDAAIGKFIDLKSLNYSFLEVFELSRNVGPEGCSDFDCKVVLSGLDPSSPRLVLTFEGVRDIKLGRLEGLFKFNLNIRPIRNHQLEGLNYRVIEEEYDALSFSCRAFDAKLPMP
jgi:hypothetical protein